MNADYIKRSFKYDRQTGELIWRHRDDMASQWNGRLAGKVAGSLWFKGNGARAEKRIHVFDKQYQAARIIWAYHNGEMPPPDKYVGFKDNDPMNTRIENLYLTENSSAQMKRKTNYKRKETHGFKGVYRKGNGFRAMITINKKPMYLGFFKTPELAAEKYNEAAKKHLGEDVTLNEIPKKMSEGDIF